MRYYALLTILTYCSMVVAVSAVATSEEDPVYVLIVAVGCLLSWPTDRLGRPAPVPIRVLVLGSIFGYALVGALLWGSNPILALGHLVAFAMLVKITAVKGPRDYLQIYVLCLCEVIVGGYFAGHVVFAAILVAFLATTGWAMMLLAMTGPARVWVKSGSRDYAARTLDRGRLPAFDQAVGVSRLRFLGRTSVYIPALLAPAVLVFLLTPRGSVQRYGLPGGGGVQAITGFNEQVQLGEMAQILENSAVVMQVKITDPISREPLERPGVPLLWRGITLDTYKPTGRGTWQWRKSGSEMVDYALGSRLARERDYPMETLVQQDVLLQPIDSSCLFALSPVVLLKSPTLRRVSMYRDDGAIRASAPPPSVREYTVFSARRPILERDTPNTRHLGLSQLSDENRDVLKRFAEKIAPAELYPGPLAKAQAIVNYCTLSGQLRYSLTYQGAPGAEPVTDFLTNTHEGHCELFASAMALMLRTQGIHSRIVNGFRGGEWNPMGRFIQVRQRDAHSWVEAYLPGQGWRAFDPTPGAVIEGLRREDSVGGFVTQFCDFLKWIWLQHVLQYDAAQQEDVLGAVTDVVSAGRTAVVWNHVALREAWGAWRDTAQGAARRIGLSGRALDVFVVAMTGAVAAALVAGVVFGVRHLSRRRRAPVAPVEFYQDLLRALARLGFVRRLSQTPMEFAARVADAAPQSLHAVPWITEQYYRVRFGRRAPDDSLWTRLRQVLEQVARRPTSRRALLPRPRGRR